MVKLRQIWLNFWKSVWLFPALATLCLVILTALQISGTSVGAYHSYFYGSESDPNLLVGQPRTIRSDEWLANTQSIIAQSVENFPRNNPNIGDGQEMSVVVDAPYRDWSVLFRPQSLPFFVMPLENAFALRWWLMGYLLVLGCYFFVLKLMPKQRLIAALVALAVFYSGFVQWWYTIGTLGSLFSAFWLMLIGMEMLTAQHWRKQLWLGLLLAYVSTVFILILYPPFQIPCALVVVFFLIGYILSQWSKQGGRTIGRALLIALGSVVLAGVMTWAYISTRSDVVNTINQTEYPGTRVFQAGGFPASHFWSSQLGYQLNFRSKTDNYLLGDYKPTNQSEASNFLLLLPFLILPAFALLVRSKRDGVAFSWPLLTLSALFAIFILEMFVPSFTPYSSALLLDKVGPYRILIGLGLLNTVFLALVVREFLDRRLKYPARLAATYAGIVLAILLAWALIIVRYPSNFVTAEAACWLSLPVATAVFLLIWGRPAWALAIYAAFSFFSTAIVNPLYRGLDVVVDNPVSVAIRELAAGSDQKWVTDGGYLVNIGPVNGASSLSAVYSYPQAELWRELPGVTEAEYDRYAHVSFRLTDNPATKPDIDLVSADSFIVTLYACDPYLVKMNVGFVLMPSELTAPCLQPQRVIDVPATTLYFYKLLAS